MKPTVFINLVPDHVIFHRMYPMAVDRTVVECDWLYTGDVLGACVEATFTAALERQILNLSLLQQLRAAPDADEWYKTRTRRTSRRGS